MEISRSFPLHLRWLLMEQGDPTPNPAFGYRRYLPQESSADECFDLLEQWIRICTREHTLCGAASTSRLPKRVLDLTAKIQDGRAVLYESYGERALYVALSHCWGSSQIIQTTKATIGTFRCGIELWSLSKTFQDAVYICRRLGVRYLWIDSLCIIQAGISAGSYNICRLIMLDRMTKQTGPKRLARWLQYMKVPT